MRKELSFTADVIIIAIGENAAALKTAEDKAQFEKAFTALLAELQRHGQPNIFVRSQFWADGSKDELLKKCCLEAGGTFVDISKLGQVESNFARAEQHIEHAGVAGHPGDKGMQALASALWEAVEKRSRQ